MEMARMTRRKGPRNLKRYIVPLTLGISLACGACGSAEVSRGSDGDTGGSGSGARSGEGGGDGEGGDGSGASSSGQGGVGGDMFGGGFGASAASGNADGGPTRPGDTCAADKAEVKPVGLDIALLVDTSYSMDFDLRWQYVKGALLSFVAQPDQDDLGLSLQFFPLRAQCDIDTYAEPALAMNSVSDARSDIETTVNARRMSGGTPIVQALQGMGEYATDWAKKHTDRKTVVVMATDGVPDATCSTATSDPPNDITNAAKTAKALLDGSPSIPVFVIGVGAELDALGAIAVAGGTDHAVLIKDGESAQKEFLAALKDIQQKSLTCEYLVPADSDGIDFDTVNVEFTQGTNKSDFFYVDTEGRCNLKPEAGWYYDDPDAPTKVVLCPATCERVSKAVAARIDIAYGCTRRIPR
jgi:Mg-chelatase subunit ChlD